MVNYIKAELYRSFNRLYLWIYAAVISGMAVFVITAFKKQNCYMPFSKMISEFDVLVMAIFLVAGMIDMVTAEEHKDGTLKNVLSYGLSRNKMIVSKFISSLILSFIFAGIIIAFIFGTMAVCWGIGSNFTNDVRSSFSMMAVSLPLWIASEALGTFLALAFSNNMIFTVVYIAVFGIVDQIVLILGTTVWSGFMSMQKYLIPTQLKHIALGHGDVNLAITSGIIYTIMFLLISFIYMKRKDVK